MKIAYLVLAHQNPKLLQRAIERLSCEDCVFFIHIDEKSSIQQFSGISGKNICFVKRRTPVYWGDYSQVRAILLLVRQALEQEQTYDYLVLLSGNDYPLRSAKYIHAFLEKNRGLEFISLVKMPNEAAGKQLSHINQIWIPCDKPVRRFAMRVLGKLGLARRDYRKHLGNLEPYCGSEWWALTNGACQYILEFIERNPHVEKYFETTPAPDEMFFHTILGNSALAPRIRRNLVYTDWSSGGSSPATLTDQHISSCFEPQEKVWLNDVFGEGEALFARKFSDNSLELLQRMDRMIAQKELANGSVASITP
jgi:hypothetical protein